MRGDDFNMEQVPKWMGRHVPGCRLSVWTNYFRVDNCSSRTNVQGGLPRWRFVQGTQHDMISCPVDLTMV